VGPGGLDQAINLVPVVQQQDFGRCLSGLVTPIFPGLRVREAGAVTRIGPARTPTPSWDRRSSLWSLRGALSCARWTASPHCDLRRDQP
jgi:hypothetical protein